MLDVPIESTYATVHVVRSSPGPNDSGGRHFVHGRICPKGRGCVADSIHLIDVVSIWFSGLTPGNTPHGRGNQVADAVCV